MVGNLRFINRTAVDAAVIAGVVFVAALVGIYSRRAGLTAAFWPANPIMIGLLVRAPRFGHPVCWVAAFVGFMAADLVTGGPLDRTLALTLGNLVAVAAAWGVLMALPEAYRQLTRASSIVWVAMACTVGALAAGVFGLHIGPQYFDTPALEGAAIWAASEFVCSMALLPVLLSAPRLRRGTERPIRAFGARARRVLGPFALLVALMAAGALIGGPVAIAAAVPALLWCALSAGVFETAVLTLAASVWTVVAATHGLVDPLQSTDLTNRQVLSIQMALALMAMGPIAAAAHVTDRKQAFDRLREAADRDPLTGALTRRAFESVAAETLAVLAAERRPVAILAVDVDQFKEVNDGHGHAVGDRVLGCLGAVAFACMRDTDRFGRLGGDEFCLIMPGASFDTALLAAERLRSRFEDACASGEAGLVAATVSIGVEARVVAPTRLAELVEAADQALYRAKAVGRNRVILAKQQPINE